MMTFGWLLALAPFLLGRKKPQPVIRDWKELTDAGRKAILQGWKRGPDYPATAEKSNP